MKLIFFFFEFVNSGVIFKNRSFFYSLKLQETLPRVLLHFLCNGQELASTATFDSTRDSNSSFLTPTSSNCECSGSSHYVILLNFLCGIQKAKKNRLFLVTKGLTKASHVIVHCRETQALLAAGLWWVVRCQVNKTCIFYVNSCCTYITNCSLNISCRRQKMDPQLFFFKFLLCHINLLCFSWQPAAPPTGPSVLSFYVCVILFTGLRWLWTCEVRWCSEGWLCSYEARGAAERARERFDNCSLTLFLQRTENLTTLQQQGVTGRSDTKLPYLDVKPTVSLKWKSFFNYSSTVLEPISFTRLYDATAQIKMSQLNPFFHQLVSHETPLCCWLSHNLYKVIVV